MLMLFCSALVTASDICILTFCKPSFSFVRAVLWLQVIIEALCTAAAHAGGVTMPTTESAARVLHALVTARYKALRNLSLPATLHTASPGLHAIPFTNTSSQQPDFAKTGAAATFAAAIFAAVHWHRVLKLLVFVPGQPSRANQSSCPPSAAHVR